MQSASCPRNRSSMRAIQITAQSSFRSFRGVRQTPLCQQQCEGPPPHRAAVLPAAPMVLNPTAQPTTAVAHAPPPHFCGGRQGSVQYNCCKLQCLKRYCGWFSASDCSGCYYIGSLNLGKHNTLRDNAHRRMLQRNLTAFERQNDYRADLQVSGVAPGCMDPWLGTG